MFKANMKTQPLTKLQLDLMVAGGCSTPDCKHENHNTLHLHGRCHTHGRIEVSYTQKTGVLCVACAECHQVIANVKVADY